MVEMAVRREGGRGRTLLRVPALCAALLLASCQSESGRTPVSSPLPSPPLPASLLPESALPGQTLVPTLELRAIDGVSVPFQNGIPVPTFDPQARDIIPLAGEWRALRFSADHDVTMARRTREWVAAREKEGRGITGTPFDDTGLGLRTLPGSENRITLSMSAGAVERYENGVWYRRHFTVPEAATGRALFLKCLGVSYVVDVWVNGTWAGWHEGGYTPFAFEIDRLVHPGENLVALRIDNPPWGSRRDTIPASGGTDFFNYTGVIQDIFIEAVPAVSVSRLDTVPGADGSVRLRALLFNASDRARTVVLSGDIADTDSAAPGWLASPQAASIGGRAAAALQERNVEVGPRQALPVEYSVRIPSARAWSPLHPNLYVATLTVVSEGERDTLSTQFGLRTLTAEHARILLNGESVFLAGIARHEDWPVYGRTASWDRIVNDLQLIRGLSATMVRTAHYPNHPSTYIALDRLGLAAMSEIPLWQFEAVNFQVQEVRGIAEQMWREMIFSQYNRPSVLLWSTQNESNAPDLRVAYNARLVRDLRDHYDDGRLVTQSAAADRPGAEDPSMAPLDVAGWTMYFGVFHGSTPYEGTRDFLTAAHARWPEKPILNTEFGYWSGETGTEAAAQLDVTRETLRALMERAVDTSGASPGGLSPGGLSPGGLSPGGPSPGGLSTGGPSTDGDRFLAGIDYWTAFDWFVNHNRWIQTMGLYGMDRTTEKPAAAFIRQSYGSLPSSAPGDGGVARPPA